MFRVFHLPLGTIDNGSVNYTTPLTQEGYSFDTLAELHVSNQENGTDKHTHAMPVMRLKYFYFIKNEYYFT